MNVSRPIASLCSLLRFLFIGGILFCGTYNYARQVQFQHLTLENGLSNNSAMTIVQDKTGFLWIGTRYGLNRYDGHQFRQYRTEAGNTHSLSNNQVNALLVDTEGVLWVGTTNGLNRYDIAKDAFERIPLVQDNKDGLSNNSVNCIYEDRTKHLWIGTKNGLVRLTDKKLPKFDAFFYSNTAGGNNIRSVTEDHNGNLWVGTTEGLLCMPAQGSKGQNHRLYRKTGATGSLSDDYITTIMEDSRQNLWIGTLTGGLNLLDPVHQTFTVYRENGNGIHHLANNNVRTIREDYAGRLWVGTQDGITVLEPGYQHSITYRHEAENNASLNNNSVHCIFEDRNKAIWIGTYFGGLNVNYPYRNAFTAYKDSKSAFGLNHNVINSMVEDDAHNLLIGTDGGGLNIYNRHTGSFKNYDRNSGLSSNVIKFLYKDKHSNIWIGTRSGGLDLLEKGSQQFRHFSQAQPEQLSLDEITAMLEDSKGQLWVGAESGLYLLEQENGMYKPILAKAPLGMQLRSRSIRCLMEDDQQNIWMGTVGGLHRWIRNTGELQSFITNDAGLQSNYINCLYQDSQKRIWIGTNYGGLSLYQASKKQFITFTDKDGLSDNSVWGILEDAKGHLWLSTDNGLTEFNPADHKTRVYNMTDGLPGNKFNANAFLKDRKGEMFFGGNSGFVSFFPDNIHINTYAAPVVFTALQLFNKPVNITPGKGLLQQSIYLTRDITLAHDQNVFSIDFVLLSYMKPEKNRYTYKLEGFEKQWNYTGNHSATYTNLPPGRYTFMVKGINNDGTFSSNTATLRIHVKAPFWKTGWAYLAYVLVFSFTLFFLLRFFWMKDRFNREREIQQFKLNFFTNISHEIRTLLTLISGPVENLLMVKPDNSATYVQTVTRQLHYLKNNTDRLLYLVNELMDFRKAETNNLVLHLHEQDITVFLEDIHASFREMAAARHINLQFRSEQPAKLPFDHRQMEKVFFNLLTNAFKFTPDGGAISIEVLDKNNKVEIRISDNGKGITPENLKKIFTNFFQVEDNLDRNTGYGIGLALAKSIVELHRGSLTVESQPAAPQKAGYTCFTVSLHKYEPQAQQHAILSDEPAETTLLTAEQEPRAPETEKPVILVIDDNAEVRQFVEDILAPQHTILTAVNGRLGWEMAIEQIPDLVICDIMMPEMDGLELCGKLKTDERTSHIPVIMLTAKTAHTHQLGGLETGADLYLTKPFSTQLLLLHVKNFLLLRAAIRRKYSRHPLTVEPKSVATNNIDELFIGKVVAITEELMNNPAFDITMLATKVAMSKSVLYKKIRAITDMSVHDFIISIRLKRAAQLLEQNQLNITEIAYAVGYSDRKYFSKEFKKYYGKAPSDFMENKENNQQVL